MRPYWGFFRTRFRALLQYRTAAFAGICTQVLFGIVKIFALHAFYQFSDAVQPMSFVQTASYVWLGQAMLRMLPWDIEKELGASVRTGQVAYELSRPLDLYAMWYARCLATRTAPTLLRAVPQFLISIFLIPAPYGMVFPGWNVFFAWLLATVGALLLSCAITSLLNISLLWLVSGEGLVRLAPSVVQIFSGMTIPLRLFPDAMQTVLRYQPFMGLVDGPAQIFVGSMPLSELPQLLALQLGWTIAFVLLGRFLMKRGLRQVAVAGG